MKCHLSISQTSNGRLIQSVFSINFILFVMKPGSKLPLEDGKEIQEVTANLAAAKGISIDAALVAVLSELHGIFTFNEEQRIALKTLLGIQHVSLSS